MRAIDLWALTSDLDPKAPLKTKVGDTTLNITGYRLENDNFILEARADGQPKNLGTFISIAQQPAVRKLPVRVRRVDTEDAPARIIFGCQFRERAVVLK
ncbi:hypothetical protein [Lacticaseibacillus hulanensis]|uniref:hypothetical protein n=1 Tax=Lacticaseibacillus hulanensis TaxID=2493111 RepID=UPI000FD9551C|nr:hypothetical protein [Lacticaseibacillus hulanensis]